MPGDDDSSPSDRPFPREPLGQTQFAQGSSGGVGEAGEKDLQTQVEELRAEVTRLSQQLADLKAERAGSHLRYRGRRAYGELAKGAEEAGGELRESVSAAGAAFENIKDEIYDQGQEIVDRARSQMRHAAYDIESRIIDAPITSVLLAFGAGMVFAMVRRR